MEVRALQTALELCASPAEGEALRRELEQLRGSPPPRGEQAIGMTASPEETEAEDSSPDTVRRDRVIQERLSWPPTQSSEG